MKTREKLILDLADYAKDSWNDDTGGEGTDLLSALVDLVDTAREYPKQFHGLTQEERERSIATWILLHRAN